MTDIFWFVNTHGLISDGSSVVFIWVPGHVGLAGNSAADSAAKDVLLLPVSSLTVPHSDYKSLIRLQALKQWQLHWNCETENKLHSIEPRVNVINKFRLPQRDEIIIQRLRIGHTYLTHGYFKGRLPLGAWLVKWIWLLSMTCFIVVPIQILVIIVFVLLWTPCLNCFQKSLHVQ